MEFKDKLDANAKEVEEAIKLYLPPSQTRPERIHQAMQYSMTAGGKRIRPVLLLATSRIFQPRLDPLPAAVAIECLHTYSLIHDDLPSIDDSELRRGRPSSHVEFDEATAVLAGDALLTYAFQLLSRHYGDHAAVGLKLVSILSETAGSERLIGGQMEDILGEKRQLSEADLEFIHLNKTSAMIEAAIEMGCVLGDAGSQEKDSLLRYGRCIGLAFQIIDDILDATSDAATLGKTVGNDEELNKTTYVSIHGLDRSRVIARQLTAEAIERCQSIDADTSFLQGLAAYLNDRFD